MEKTNTRQKRNNILRRYKGKAKKNRIKFDYQKAKQIDLYAKTNRISVKKAFDKFTDDKLTNKVRYIERKYDLSKRQAREILDISFKEKKKYSAIVKEKGIVKGLEFPIVQQNFLDIIDFTGSHIVRPDAKIKFIQFGKTIETNITSWLDVDRFEARKELEENSLAEYPVIQDLYDVETERDKQGFILQFNIKHI